MGGQSRRGRRNDEYAARSRWPALQRGVFAVGTGEVWRADGVGSVATVYEVWLMCDGIVVHTSLRLHLARE
jgi:hypothetical protein